MVSHEQGMLIHEQGMNKEREFIKQGTLSHETGTLITQTDLSVGVLTVLLEGREVMSIWNLPANLQN